MSLNTSLHLEKHKKLVYGTGAFALVFLIGLGIFASNGWLPRTDRLTGKRLEI